MRNDYPAHLVPLLRMTLLADTQMDALLVSVGTPTDEDPLPAPWTVEDVLAMLQKAVADDSPLADELRDHWTAARARTN